MSIKQLVNTPDIYNAFLEHLDTLITKEHKTLETNSEPHLIYKAQGAVAVLKRLKQLREIINNEPSRNPNKS